MRGDPESAIAGLPPQVTRVRKAYEQVADQLRALIVSGTLRPGQRLPNEQELSSQFGVSRPTVREALRLLAAERLIKAAKGVNGGTFVSMPTVDHLSEFMSTGIALLTQGDAITLDELLEAREQLEVPCARLAAERHTAEDLQRLGDQVPEQLAGLSISDQFAFNKGFHSALVDAAGNALLAIAAQPIFVVLQTHLARSHLTGRDHRLINEAHHRIARAIEQGDGSTAQDEMREHLHELRPLYRKAWRAAGRRL